ncbi:MAG: glycosyltransferase family 2 protein [Parcubacteria group bacterium]|nr:glycosyltransferase family 2 protein [Parcubacteria group bacterium]
MKEPLVSVVMPTYNRARFLDRAVKSVRTQSFPDWELIIGDDASKDDTPTIARNLAEKDPRIVYIRYETNAGVTRNYNRVMQAARGKYIAIIDDDDPWVGTERLKKQVEFLETHPDYVGVGGGMIVVDQEGKELFRYLKPERDKEIHRSMLFSNPMANSTTVFRKQEGGKVGFYDPDVPRGADRDFWLKMGRLGKLYNFPDYFAYYTIAQNSLFKNQRQLFSSNLHFLKKYKSDYPFYLPALIFTYGLYTYSFLPERVREILNMPLFYLKRKVFDKV